MKRNFILIVFALLTAFLFIPKANAETPLSKKFKLICEEPCGAATKLGPLDEEYKKDFKKNMIIAYLKLKQLTKTDLPKEKFPINIHLTIDKICDTQAPHAAFARPYMTPGVICILTKPKFKIRKYLNTYHEFLAHELAHFYFPDSENQLDLIEHPLIYSLGEFIASPHVFTPELLKEYGSYAWDPNAKKSFCYDRYFNVNDTPYRLKMYNLCTQYGFDLKHVPAFLKELLAWTDANPGKLITKQDYVEIFKKILGKDVSSVL